LSEMMGRRTKVQRTQSTLHLNIGDSTSHRALGGACTAKPDCHPVDASAGRRFYFPYDACY
jgi:hypothetical protein